MLCGISLSRRRTPIAARTKIEVNPALCRQVSGLDDLARIVFPDNPNHRKAFVGVWIEIKYAEEQFQPSRSDLCARYGITRRTLEIVRAKLRKLGIIKRVSHFNPAYGHQPGWTFSDRFGAALSSLVAATKAHREPTGRPQDRLKDEQALLFV